MDMNYGHHLPLLDSCDIFYGIELSLSMDSDVHTSQGLMDATSKPSQQQQQQHHNVTTTTTSACQTINTMQLEAINTQMPAFLDCTPDLIPNDTPDDDPLTSFDDLYTLMSSPHVSSYLQYLKEPALHATDSTEFLDFLEGGQPVQDHGMDPTFAARASFHGVGSDSNPLLMYTDSSLYLNSLPSSGNGGGNNWLYESGGNSCILPQNLDNAFGGIGQPVHESVTSGMVSMAECDMAREYVSLSDVNSFVAEVDSQKHAASIHLSYSTPENLQLLGDKNNNTSNTTSDFATLATFSSVPNMLGSCSTYPQQHHHHQRTGFATPIQEDDTSDSETESSTLSSCYRRSKKWAENDKASYNVIKATRARKQAPKKSKSDILLHIKKNRLRKNNARGLQLKASTSTRHLPTSPNTPPSLPPSDSISSILARQKISSSSSSAAIDEDLEDMDDDEDEEYIFRGDTGAEEDDDDTFTFHPGQSSSGRTASSGSHHLRKGRNVDKACNHCKRSHLRCDNMRPCRRCVATGKTGCKDVEHKPRGRPRLNKNQVNVKKEILNSILPE